MVEMTVFLASWFAGDLVALIVSIWTLKVMFRLVGLTFCYN